ncbi:MAG: methylmalonyl-CoA mutase family protein [Myxococcales bacterium]|nr:methylmalonyl-CoA mutase family protein [Myxococcales bacterium]
MSNPREQLVATPGPLQPVRVVTAASLFDGHDVAINIMRRILQAQGAEVIHLGHDRSVQEIVDAAIQEDAHAIAASSYQGGHIEFFSYMVEELRARGAPDVLVYGGGGGTITPDEIELLEGSGVARIFSPELGRELGLEGMICTIIDECREQAREIASDEVSKLAADDPRSIARVISLVESTHARGETETLAWASLRARLTAMAGERAALVLGLTGTGGAGKSSVLDEILRRLRRDAPEAKIALLLVDPTRRRSGGALLGDRIRLNALGGPNVFVRSMATRQANLALSQSVADSLRVLKAARFDLVILETAGIGQSDSEVVDLVDLSAYVMTPEYGAPSQLEKIDMLELSDYIVINKSDRRGALDALRDVRKQWKRNNVAFETPDEQVPVFPAIAHQWNDPGVDRLYEAIRRDLVTSGARVFEGDAPAVQTADVGSGAILPASSERYLAEIAETVRDYRKQTEVMAERAAVAEGIARTLRDLDADATASPLLDAGAREALAERRQSILDGLPAELRTALTGWPATRERYTASEQNYQVRDREIKVRNYHETLSGTAVAKVALPRTDDWGALARYLRLENLPGSFPFTSGVFPFKREGEDPTRMFAGEGTPERTNRRFHYLCRGQSAARLSTAFDSVTLYGRNPDRRPDIFGKVGNSGVSVCSLDDAKKLYSGFDLCDPATSVSLTINGPAPIILAFFLNAAIDQQVEKHLIECGELEAVRERLGGDGLPEYGGDLPDGHDGLGLGLLGISGDRAVDIETYERIKASTLSRVRGTVQADILKEDQAQNTCIFSIGFALKMMGDIQQYFVDHGVHKFYSVSISGYHMAEAGANPITQLAFTLANGLTFVEYYRARGMEVDDFAANFSFFFSNGLDLEYNVIGRVARRIWAIAMRDRYGASARSQKLKYHIQTSGRSLHAQEMHFNDIRTTLQALTALQDNCNSLHTNAFDEAVTTPTEDSVRRAVAIQLIIQRELGTAKNENPTQGSYLIEQLTDQVEAAVLAEFDRLSERGGVLGAMETLYQRSKIQQESLHYESLKHSGELPIVGVNTFENPNPAEAVVGTVDLMRSSDAEKQAQLDNLHAFKRRFAPDCAGALEVLKDAAAGGDNVFEALLEAVKVATLGETSDALFEVGGRYRRAM